MKKFKVGQKYVHYDWFTGGQIFFEVDSVKCNKVRLLTKDHELDGDHTRAEEYEIKKNDNGDEYIVLFTYRDVRCVIEAQEAE
jgi:hypothetical protein